MAPLRVNLVPGIGRFRRKILLEELNITLVRELAMLDVGDLKPIFGRQAYLVHQRTLGIDSTPVFPPSMKPLVSEEIMLSQDENDDQKLLGTLYTLMEKCSLRLRHRALDLRLDAQSVGAHAHGIGLDQREQPLGVLQPG